MENRLARGKRKIFTRRVHREPLTTFDSDCKEDRPKKLCRIAPEDQAQSMENRLARGGKRKIFTRRVHREPLTTFDSDCKEDRPKMLCRIAPEDLPGSGEKRATHPQPKTSFSATVAQKDPQRHQDGKAKENDGDSTQELMISCSTSNAGSQKESEQFDSDSETFDYSQWVQEQLEEIRKLHQLLNEAVGHFCTNSSV